MSYLAFWTVVRSCPCLPGLLLCLKAVDVALLRFCTWEVPTPHFGVRHEELMLQVRSETPPVRRPCTSWLCQVLNPVFQVLHQLSSASVWVQFPHFPPLEHLLLSPPLLGHKFFSFSETLTELWRFRLRLGIGWSRILADFLELWLYANAVLSCWTGQWIPHSAEGDVPVPMCPPYSHNLSTLSSTPTYPSYSAFCPQFVPPEVYTEAVIIYFWTELFHVFKHNLCCLHQQIYWRNKSKQGNFMKILLWIEIWLSTWKTPVTVSLAPCCPRDVTGQNISCKQTDRYGHASATVVIVRLGQAGISQDVRQFNTGLLNMLTYGQAVSSPIFGTFKISANSLQK